MCGPSCFLDPVTAVKFGACTLPCTGQISLDQQASTLTNITAQSLSAYRTAEQVRMELQRVLADDSPALMSGVSSFKHTPVDTDAIAAAAAKLTTAAIEDTVDRKLAAALQIRSGHLEERLSGVERLVSAVVKSEVDPKIAVMQEKIVEVCAVTRMRPYPTLVGCPYD